MTRRERKRGKKGKKERAKEKKREGKREERGAMLTRKYKRKLGCVGV